MLDDLVQPAAVDRVEDSGLGDACYLHEQRSPVIWLVHRGTHLDEEPFVDLVLSQVRDDSLYCRRELLGRQALSIFRGPGAHIPSGVRPVNSNRVDLPFAWLFPGGEDHQREL